MGIDRIHTTLPAYTSLQRRGRVRKGKGSSDDDLAEESQSDNVEENVDPHESGKQDPSHHEKGHIDERV